jgi:hypothetical protein
MAREAGDHLRKTEVNTVAIVISIYSSILALAVWQESQSTQELSS